MRSCVSEVVVKSLLNVCSDGLAFGHLHVIISKAVLSPTRKMICIVADAFVCWWLSLIVVRTKSEGIACE